MEMRRGAGAGAGRTTAGSRVSVGSATGEGEVAAGNDKDDGSDEAIRYEALTRFVLNGPKPVTSTEMSSPAKDSVGAVAGAAATGIRESMPQSPMMSSRYATVSERASALGKCGVYILVSPLN